MSCNACKVLRKGCTADCTLKPCLQWIETPESQANATVFLAKFYGRAGLINLINSAPHHLHPDIFRSLLYEACGRIINPLHGSVGLMWSENWQLCQSAVEAVLQGSPVMQIFDDNAVAEGQPVMPRKGCDIRHQNKNPNGIHRVRTRNYFKRSGLHGKSHVNNDHHNDGGGTKVELIKRAPSNDSFSVEKVEPILANRAEWVRVVKSDTSMVEAEEKDADLALDLTLGFNPVLRSHKFNGEGSQ